MINNTYNNVLKSNYIFFVVFTLPVFELGHVQIRVPKIGIPMLQKACINPW